MPKSQGTKPANKGDPEIIVRRSSRTSTDEESDSKPILYIIYSTYNKPTKPQFQLPETYISAHDEYCFCHLLDTYNMAHIVKFIIYYNMKHIICT